jgi:hypothetical protein
LLDFRVGALEALTRRDSGLCAAIFQGVNEQWNVDRIVLPVAVNSGDDAAMRGKHAGAHGRALAGRPVMQNVPQMRCARFDARIQHFACVIRRAVIDHDHLKRTARQRLVHLVQENGEVVGFILAGDDDGDFGGDFWLWQFKFPAPLKCARF